MVENQSQNQDENEMKNQVENQGGNKFENQNRNNRRRNSINTNHGWQLDRKSRTFMQFYSIKNKLAYKYFFTKRKVYFLVNFYKDLCL